LGRIHCDALLALVHASNTFSRDVWINRSTNSLPVGISDSVVMLFSWLLAQSSSAWPLVCQLDGRASLGARRRGLRFRPLELSFPPIADRLAWRTAEQDECSQPGLLASPLAGVEAWLC
jgi:hypothetical protein